MLSFFRYRLPFKKPFSTGIGTFRFREGIILQFVQDNIAAYGEVAPLPGFSHESIDQILPVLELNKKHIEKAIHQGDESQFLYLLKQIHNLPSLLFGLDILFNDFRAKLQNQPLSKHLFPDASERVKANAVISMESTKETLRTAQISISKGFDTIKLKVGTDFEKEKKIIKSLRAELPEIKIRLDANQSWEADQAIKYLDILQPFEIEYCEQPVPKDDFEGLKKVSLNSSIKIAADESLRNKKDAERLIENGAVHLFIMKPMIFGTIHDIDVTIKLAHSHAIDVVFTTSLESIIGRTATATLASGWGNKALAHGLSTGSLLKSDLGSQSGLKSGHYEFNKKPGIGIDIDISKLREI